ncbi:MAG: hypothetical protein M3323_09315 [Actinomycetota bacterium]|nr:hypothetical protein [Actinomycetota bacterium]
MKSHRTIRILSVMASAALIVGAFTAGPADAKKKKKKPPAAGCPAYSPSEWSKDIPVTKVTDEHTADAPLTIEVPTEMGFGSSSPEPPAEDPKNPISRVFLNVQVDSAAPTTGLYATVEHTPMLDYDLYIRDTFGVGQAYSAGFAPGVPFLDGTGHGGHTGLGSENIEGLTSEDCTGYLVDIISATTPGEEVTLTLWLGEATYVPGA